MSAFAPAFAFLLPLEGGFTSDQDGTNMGVTQADYDAWRSVHEQPAQSVALLTPSEAQAYYFVRWWASGPYSLIADQELANRVFQLAVVMGEVESIKVLQRAIGVNADGVFGPQTSAATNAIAWTGHQLDRWRVEAAKVFAEIALRNPLKQRDLPGWLLHRALA